MFTTVNVKQEQFLWLVIDGMPQEQAYAKVYGEAKSRNVCAASASRLLSRDNMVARRQEIIAARHASRPISLQYLSNELMAIAQEARAYKQQAAATAAVMGVAKLHGLLVDRVSLDAVVRKPSDSSDAPDTMSELEWMADFGLTIEHQPEVAQPDSNSQHIDALQQSLYLSHNLRLLKILQLYLIHNPR